MFVQSTELPRIYLTVVYQVESSQQAAGPSRGMVNATGVSKLELRRIQMLTRQRERLQQEAQVLRAEVDDLVSCSCPFDYSKVTPPNRYRNWPL